MRRGMILQFPWRELHLQATAKQAAEADNVGGVWVWREGMWVRVLPPRPDEQHKPRKRA